MDTDLDLTNRRERMAYTRVRTVWRFLSFHCDGNPPQESNADFLKLSCDKKENGCMIRPIGMITRRLFLRSVALLAGGLWAGGVRAAPIRVCSSCGHEALHDGPTCLHCGASLPPIREEPIPERPVASEPSTGSPPASPPALLPHGIEAQEFRWAQQLFEVGEFWGAMLAARNAAALAALQGESGAATRAAAAAMIVDARRRLFVVRRSCPVCDGSGHKKIQIVTLKGDVVEQNLPMQPCGSCGGTGLWNGRPLLDELARVEATALRAFGVEQMRRGREEVRGVWLPRGVSDRLSVRSIAAMRTAVGAPCAACKGFGAVGCTACRGAGRIRCTNSRCVHGTQICPDCGGKGRQTTTHQSGTLTKRCATCGGTGKISCPVCGGKGELVCGRCEGRGEALCTTCEGRGEAALCTRCQGQGFVTCTRCQGTGKVRDQLCATCKGEGVILCANCQGSGRLARGR